MPLLERSTVRSTNRDRDSDRTHDMAGGDIYLGTYLGTLW